MTIKGVLFAVLFAFSSVLYAADIDGKFAVKGAGRKACTDFMQAKSSGSNDYLLYAGWVEGFLSSYNQFQPKNYDITPWQTTELLLLLVSEQCKATPDSRMLSVVNGLLKALFSIRLQTESDIVKVSLDGRETYYYSEILKRVKSRLKIATNYKGDEKSDSFGAEEIIAIVNFQKKMGLTVTRVLDQNTLSRLFLKPSK
jgi:Putative peptidoglycan binding domain